MPSFSDVADPRGLNTSNSGRAGSVPKLHSFSGSRHALPAHLDATTYAAKSAPCVLPADSTVLGRQFTLYVLPAARRPARRPSNALAAECCTAAPGASARTGKRGTATFVALMLRCPLRVGGLTHLSKITDWREDHQKVFRTSFLGPSCVSRTHVCGLTFALCCQGKLSCGHLASSSKSWSFPLIWGLESGGTSSRRTDIWLSAGKIHFIEERKWLNVTSFSSLHPFRGQSG